MTKGNDSPSEEKVSQQSAASEPKNCQEKVESFFNNLFGSWATIVARNPCKVFWLSILVFIGFASGMGQARNFEDEQLVWTPKGNPSVKNRDRGQEMFPSKGGFIGIMIESKEDYDSILTLNAFKEMK